METFYFVMFIFAAIGIYHIIEEIVWQIDKAIHHDEIEQMIDLMEIQKANREKHRNK